MVSGDRQSPVGDATARTDSNIRQKLAFTMIIAGLGVIGVLSGLVIGFADDEGRPEATRLVFVSVLPLMGTWVGTVLAFYFARENLEAATTSTIQLGKSLRSDTSVTEVMIPAARIVACRLAAGADAKQVTLADLVATMKGNGFQRIPVLVDERVVYVIHKSTLAAFADEIQKSVDTLAGETIDDLVSGPAFAELVTAMNFVAGDAVLEKARAAMGSVPHCNDVFVTSDGKASGVLLGWLTNTDLSGLS